MTTIQKIEASKQEIGNVEEKYRGLFTHGVSLRHLVNEKNIEILNILSFGGWPDVMKPLSDATFVHALATSLPMTSLPILREMLRVVEESEDYKRACEIIQPITDRIAALEADAEAEAAAYAGQINAIRDAEEIVTQKAMLAIERDPTLSKLRAAAETARPAHIEPQPFRGRVQLAVID